MPVNTNLELPVNEIFISLQGEGLYAGVPMIFIRLQGCNLHPPCTWCDTLYAHDLDPKEGFKFMTIDDIHNKVVSILPNLNTWVCITGGEPLLQGNLMQLVQFLKGSTYKLEIETNGSIRPPDWYTIVDSWVADIKCPSSGHISDYSWFDTRTCDQVKFVVANGEDLDYVRTVIKTKLISKPTIMVSPVGNPLISNDWMMQVAQFCMAERVRLSLQLHRIIWGTKRGV